MDTVCSGLGPGWRGRGGRGLAQFEFPPVKSSTRLWCLRGNTYCRPRPTAKSGPWGSSQTQFQMTGDREWVM